MVFKKGNTFGGKKKLIIDTVVGKPHVKDKFDKLMDEDENDGKPRCKTCKKVVGSDLIDMCYSCVEKKQPGGVFGPPMRYISGTSVKKDKPKDNDNK